jgi:hypothetical protein
MAKTPNIKLTLSLKPKVDNILRTQALKMRITLSEMVERYQLAYLEKIKREKEEMKAKKITEKIE